MFSSLWEQQVWVEPAPVRNRTGERRAEECFPMTGYLPGPGLLIWARAKGDSHRRLLTVGETGAVRSFHYQPIFSLRPPPHRTVEPEWLAPYHHGVAVRVALALPVRLASRRNRAQLQGPPLLWTEIKDNYFTDKADIPTWIRADIFEKMKEMKARTLDAGHALFFPL